MFCFIGECVYFICNVLWVNVCFVGECMLDMMCFMGVCVF